MRGGGLLPAYGLILAIVNAAPAGAAPPARLVVLGDSLSAGYQLDADDAFPARLGQALAAAGYRVEVVNAGVSGDTSADGRARLDWAMGDPPPAYAIVELGANDMLRGLDPALTERNLDAILRDLAARRVKVLLAGMQASRNLGADYDDRFDAIYPALAASDHVALYPFFLDGIALDPRYTLEDRMHPNPRGVAIMVRNILPAVEALIGPAPGSAS